MGLGQGICGSWECRSSCLRSDREGHGDGDCKWNKRQVSDLLHWAEIQNNAEFEIVALTKMKQMCRRYNPTRFRFITTWWLFVKCSSMLLFIPEGSSFHILATETHMDALLEQRAKGHVLSQSPVHCPVLDHFTTALQNTTQTCLWREDEYYINRMHETCAY